MDYFDIGQRIRKCRKALNLSQEELAEKINISTTHMSHIETGNTKLSLSVLVDISEVLNVSTDFLLFDLKRESKPERIASLNSLLEKCDAKETNIIYDIIRATVESLKKNK